MKLPTFLIIIGLLICSFYAVAQPKQGVPRLDSLIAEVPNLNADSVGVRVLDAISFGYLNVAPQEAIKWATKELDLSIKIGWLRGKAFAYCNMGAYHTGRGNYDKALETLDSALKIFHQLGSDQKEAEAFIPLGTVYLYKKNYPKALEYYSNSLNFAQSIDDKEWQQQALSNIGLVYSGWCKPDEALKYLQQALKIAVSQNDISGIMLQSANIGATYANIKKFPEAIAYEFKALRLAEQLGDKQSAAIYRGNIGSNYFYVAKFGTSKADSLVSSNKAANLKKAIEYLNSSVADCRMLQYTRGVEFFTKVLDNANALKKTMDGK